MSQAQQGGGGAALMFLSSGTRKTQQIHCSEWSRWCTVKGRAEKPDQQKWVLPPLYLFWPQHHPNHPHCLYTFPGVETTSNACRSLLDLVLPVSLRLRVCFSSTSFILCLPSPRSLEAPAPAPNCDLLATSWEAFGFSICSTERKPWS